MRDHAAGLALWAGRHDAVPGAERTEAFPRGFSAGRGIEASGRLTEISCTPLITKTAGRLQATSTAPVTLEIDGRSVTVPRAPRSCAPHARRRAGSQAVRHRHAQGLRLLPPVPGGDRGPQGLSRLLHHDGGGGHESFARSRRSSRSCAAASSTCMSPITRSTAPRCPAHGHCELQDMAADAGITETSYGVAGAKHRPAPKDASNPYFTFDPELCIVCSRCVRACDEQQGTFALTIQGRGFDSKVSASQDEPFLESECVSCGACVEACPTAALTEKSVDRARASPSMSPRPPAPTAAWAVPSSGDHRRGSGRQGRAHGARSQGRRQPRPCLHQGSLRLWLRDPCGPRHEAR